MYTLQLTEFEFEVLRQKIEEASTPLIAFEGKQIESIRLKLSSAIPDDKQTK